MQLLLLLHLQLACPLLYEVQHAHDVRLMDLDSRRVDNLQEDTHHVEDMQVAGMPLVEEDILLAGIHREEDSQKAGTLVVDIHILEVDVPHSLHGDGP